MKEPKVPIVRDYGPVDPSQYPWPFAGVDEAGRGCLAGPVVAAAVILPVDFHHADIRDSKQMTEAKRYEMRDVILKHALAYSIAEGDVPSIEQRNIVQATYEAMWQAIHALNPAPVYVVIDGNRFKKGAIPHSVLIKGDDRLQAIAAASILAKTHRDDLMRQLHEETPLYEWHINKGYATARHCELLIQYGPHPQHRRGFRQVDEQYGLFRTEK